MQIKITPMPEDIGVYLLQCFDCAGDVLQTAEKFYSKHWQSHGTCEVCEEKQDQSILPGICCKNGDAQQSQQKACESKDQRRTGDQANTNPGEYIDG